MPDTRHAPLAWRVGPAMAGWTKTYARRLYEKNGLSFREIAAKIKAAQHITLTHATIRVWAVKGEWVGPVAIPAASQVPARIRDRDRSEKRSTADALTKCRHRCPVCLQFIEPGATHLCQIKAGRTMKIFGGSYL